MSDKNVELEKDLVPQEESTNEEQEFNMEDFVSSMVMPPIELNAGNLTGVKYDKKEFQAGLTSMSKSAGALTALINSGLSSALAVDYLINSETIKMNLALNVENNKASIQISKNTLTQAQNQTL